MQPCVRELCKLVRDKPQSTLFDILEEAMIWVVEDRPCFFKCCQESDYCVYRFWGDVRTVKPHQQCTQWHSSSHRSSSSVVKIIIQQGKAIVELTNVVRELTVQNGSPNSSQSEKTKYTDDGQPICIKCEGVGHIAKLVHCNHRFYSTWKQGPSIAVSQVQLTEVPLSQRGSMWSPRDRTGLKLHSRELFSIGLPISISDRPKKLRIH